MTSEVSTLETNLEDAKLFKVPTDTKTILWNHSCVGLRSKLQFATHQKPRVNIKEKIFQDAVHFLESKPEGLATCYFVGSLNYSEGASAGITLNLNKFSEHFLNPGIENVCVLVLMSRKSKGDIKRESRAYLKDLRTLYTNCRDQACMNGKYFFNWCITCSVFGTDCELKFELISLSSTFTISPLQPLPIIVSDLTEFLSKFNGDTITGFVTIDCQKQFILVPEDLETLPVLPLVGIWISGVNSNYHPLIWASCVRYISSSFYQNRLCLPPQPFLLILYQPEQELPDFYDCQFNNGNLFPKYALYEGLASIRLPKIPIYDSRALSVELEEIKDRRIEFEAAVQQIETHEITLSYPNIITNLEDENPLTCAPRFKEKHTAYMNQPVVSEVSVDDFSNLVTPVIPQNRGFATDYQAQNFNTLGHNSKLPSELANDNALNGSNCSPLLNAHNLIENRTAPSPPQFMNAHQGNTMTKSLVEWQSPSSHRESPFPPGNINTQLASRENFNQSNATDQGFFSPVIINHKHGTGRRYPKELELSTCSNNSRLRTLPHNATHAQQPLQQLYANRPNRAADGDNCVDQWHYRNRNSRVACHIEDPRYFSPATDYLTSAKQINGVRYSQDYLQNCSRQAAFSNRKAFSEGSISQCTHDSLSGRSRLCSNMCKNACGSPPIMHNLMNKKTQFEFPDMQLNNCSDPLFADDDYLPVASKITHSEKNSRSSIVSSIDASISQQQSLSASHQSTTSPENNLNVSNKSIAQNVSTAMPKKSCLKKTQSPKFSSCDSTNTSLQSNSPSITWKKTLESVEETAKSSVTTASERSINRSETTVNNRSIANKSVNKTQKQDSIQKNVKPLPKKTEIIKKQSSKVPVRQSGKIIAKTSAKAPNNPLHYSSEEKNSAAQSTADKPCLEAEPSKSEEIIKVKECIPISDNTNSVFTFDTASETNNSQSTLNTALQSVGKTIIESIKELEIANDKKFSNMENRILEALHHCNLTSPALAIKDKPHNNEQIMDQNINSRTEYHVIPEPIKYSTPNCSDPKSLPYISMSTVNTPTMQNSPNFRSDGYVLTKQTVTVIKETCSVSTMTSFDLEPITETSTGKKSHPIYKPDEKKPVNISVENRAKVSFKSRTEICNPPLIIKDKNVPNTRLHLSDSEIGKIKQRNNCHKNSQIDCNRRTLSAQENMDCDCLPVKLGKNDGGTFIQEDGKNRKKTGLQTTLGHMEEMMKVNHRHSLPNPLSENLEKRSERRLSNVETRDLPKISKPEGSKVKAKLFQTKSTNTSPRMPSPCENENSDTKLCREIEMLRKNSLEMIPEDSCCESDLLYDKYALFPDNVSILTKQYLDSHILNTEYESLND